MAASSTTTVTTSSVYLHVIEDVISKIHGEFVDNGGPGEDVLTELQGLWEAKMMQAGVILGPADRPAVTKPPPAGAAAPVHDLNVPYEGEEYETPTADMLFPPTPLQTPMPTPLPGTVDNSIYNIPTGSNDYPPPRPESGGNTGENAENKTGRSSPYMDFFVPPSGKRKREDLAPQYQNGGYIPQQDGAADALSGGLQVKGKFDLPSLLNQESEEKLADVQKSVSNRRIPQLDGQTPDPYDNMLSTPNIYNYQGVVNEDYNIASTPINNELQAGTPAHIGNNDDVDDDEPLNENDDDDVDDVDEEEEVNTQQLVLAQFDKVTRTKSKWKCTLKDGIMHINNKDILFNKATGEFEF
ncbi:hypothetical protein MLD38_040111 [Melastoma candidum]|uniref:Uncharacterized protein n=1 Tax=Melastoma candidum TaxID=119954 RepID=A0ACB9L490_9MYRT|nr:hypothetical protein MLD38_040111 [Melastoma candidum]